MVSALSLVKCVNQSSARVHNFQNPITIKIFPYTLPNKTPNRLCIDYVWRMFNITNNIYNPDAPPAGAILFTKILENQGYHQDFHTSGSSFIPPANYSFTEDSHCLCENLEFQNTHLVHGSRLRTPNLMAEFRKLLHFTIKQKCLFCNEKIFSPWNRDSDNGPRLEENDTYNQENLQSRWCLRARNDQISTHHCPRLLRKLILLP